MNLGFSRKDFISYAVLPGLKPRFRSLFLTGFAYIPYFIALVYQTVRLLPSNHPYANAANIGRFGIRAVIAEAANNLVIKRENIDQILLFFTILMGLMIIFVQLALLGLSFFMQPVMAQSLGDLLSDVFGGSNSGINIFEIFLTPEATRQHDLAGMMLDMVFGVPGIFESCVSMAGGCVNVNGEAIVGPNGQWHLAHLGFPFPIHQGLHRMFTVYSIGLLVVAVFIASYFVITVVAETAQTGTPFGKRFNKVWAPLRIVVAFGLLIPIGIGMNSSQYLVLYAAKFGSGFATNGWNLFNNTLVDSYLGQTRDLVSRPNIPEVSGLLQYLYVARVCRELELTKNERAIEAYLIGDPFSGPSNAMPILGTSYESMLEFVDGAQQVTIRFGYRPNEARNADYTGPYAKYKGYTEPTCGEITMPLKDPRMPGSDNPPEGGSETMQRYYWFVIKELWSDIFAGDTSAVAGLAGNTLGEYTANYPYNVVRRFTQWDPNPKAPLPEPAYKNALQTFYSNDLQAAMLNPSMTSLNGLIQSDEGALADSIESGQWAVSEGLEQKGWAGAGIWYNKVAELNGAVTGAILNIPSATRYPLVMEYVATKKQQQDQNVSIPKRFEPKLANGDDINFQYAEGQQMAVAMWAAYSYWEADGGAATTHTAPTGNVIIDTINAIFGTQGLMSIRKNKDVHPLAQLVGVGKSLVESSVNNLVIATGGAGLSAILGEIDKAPRAVMSVGVGFMVTIATIGLTAGFVLFYVVPFLPFIYFFFAVSGWIKGIFEAMVGAPLWALAHIRIDGNGLPGQAAVSGYFLIFEVFLRPILIVFGLLASISIFSAMVLVLNETWDLVVSNLSGFDVQAEIQSTDLFTGETFEPSLGFLRSALDEFMFTIIYTIIVYLMGMSSFKLIDLVPNNILRWMGQSISTFNDSREDPAQGMVGTATIGAQQTLSSVGQGTKGALQGIAGGALTGGGKKAG